MRYRCHAGRTQGRVHPSIGSVVNDWPILVNIRCLLCLSLESLSYHPPNPHLCGCGIAAPNLKWVEWWRMWLDVWTWLDQLTNTLFSEHHKFSWSFLSFWWYLHYPPNKKVITDTIHWNNRKMDAVYQTGLLNPIPSGISHS